MNNTLYVNPSRHGSLQNAIADQSRSKTPEVGMGVTEIMYSDRHPYTITKILSPKRIMVRACDSNRIDKNGFSDSQEYEYTENEEYPEITLFLNKFGKWKRLGDAKGSTYFVGIREEFYDFTR